MHLNFDKARKLISELEAKLNDTSFHTAAARKALDEWIQSGEVSLRKKGASALKQVRKRADSFSKALTKLEQNILTSLDRMSESLEKKNSKKPSKKNPKKAAGKAGSKKPDVAAKKKAAKSAPAPTKKSGSKEPGTKKKAAAKKGS